MLGTPAHNTAWIGSNNNRVAASSNMASARLTVGPAKLTRVRRAVVMNQVCTYTAAPGRPIPPRAMNSIGRPSESMGWL